MGAFHPTGRPSHRNPPSHVSSTVTTPDRDRNTRTDFFSKGEQHPEALKVTEAKRLPYQAHLLS